MALLISRATEADATFLSDLGRATYAAYFADIWSEEGLARHLDAEFSRERLRSELSGASVRYYLARAAGRVIGFAKLNLDRPLPVGGGEIGAEIQKVYFLPGETGRGHGGALINHVLAEARAAGYPLVWLDVLKSNAGARRAYERQGFTVVGALPFATEICDIGFWVMARPAPSEDDAPTRSR